MHPEEIGTYERMFLKVTGEHAIEVCLSPALWLIYFLCPSWVPHSPASTYASGNKKWEVTKSLPVHKWALPS
jgi:hypothetical protein